MNFGAGAARWEQVQRDGSKMQRKKEQVQRGGEGAESLEQQRAGAARFGQKQQILKYFFLKNAFSEPVQRGIGAARFSAGAARFSEQVQFFERVARCSEVGAGAARFKNNKIIKTHCPPPSLVQFYSSLVRSVPSL